MRTPTYLSPTSLSKWVKDPVTFYLDYLADHRPPREKQTQPMSIGSALDAYAKNFLHTRLFGKNHKDSSQFELATIFEKQVEPHNRDWALLHGKYVFDWYIGCGAMRDMIKELEGAIGEPRFEMEVQNFVSHDIHSVPFLGKPDISFVSSQGTKVILDWKVNGYCAKSGVSPKAGYVKAYPDFTTHKSCFLTDFKGIAINGATIDAPAGARRISLKDVDEDWNRQVIIYAWLCGSSVGEDFVLGIDQLCCRPSGMEYPNLRCAKHRYQSNYEEQIEIYRLAAECWKSVTGGQSSYFGGLRPDESKSRCDMLEQRAKDMWAGTGDDVDDLCAEMNSNGFFK